jgi:Na+/melibiose symporter-like transporter
VRSALAAFLLTVALPAFSAYFNRTQSHPFLIAAGLIFSIASLIACLTFSFRSEKAVLRFKDIWTYISGTKSMDLTTLPSCKPAFSAIP